MPDNVVSLGDYRRSLAGRTPLRCACGSWWFHLDGTDAWPEVAPHGAVTLDSSGSITGRMGTPTCVECGLEQQV